MSIFKANKNLFSELSEKPLRCDRDKAKLDGVLLNVAKILIEFVKFSAVIADPDLTLT